MLKPSAGPWKITHTALMGFRVSDSTGWGVAVVLKDTNDDANARLIAAAPQMLEALDELVDLKDRRHTLATEIYQQARERAWEKCRAAIRAAKGESKYEQQPENV